MTLLFLFFGVVTLVANLAASLLSPKAATLQHHMIGFGRLGIFAAVTCKMAQVLQTGMRPEWQWVLLVISLASIYIAQIRCEILRQRLRRRGYVR